MKTFANLNLMVLSQDFQDFLKFPEEIIVTNRPHGYPNKEFNDVYVIGQNLAFMTYLEQFKDLYIAYRLKENSDIIKAYRSTPLIATSMPKNTLTIKSSNSKNWFDSTSANPIVSSSSSGTTPTQGLRVEATVQSLIFNMKAPYGDVTSVDQAELTIPDNWGMLIMMNPKIKFNTGAAATMLPAGFTVTAETIDDVNSYNQYTLVTLKASTPGALLSKFPDPATTTQFSLSSFQINSYSSYLADEDNFDIMIATIDGIDGPLNMITYNGYFLINAFTLMSSQKLGTISSGFVAYNHNTQMDGSKVPTMLRVKGSIAGATNFHTLNIFFDELTPFFENYYNGDVFCHSTDGAPYCRF